MSYITRADGKRFVIPSYRDTLTATKGNLIKREVQLLSKNYGEYVALQRKGLDRLEVAFSSEPGILLGETVWEYFKRPSDLIYCELTSDPLKAILVIVKSGSVYLEGSFPTDSIAEELLVLKTLNNKFNVYVQGNVPIAETRADGKFSLDASSVRAFTVLDKPVFPVLPIVGSLQLQPVDVALRKQGIGTLPIKKIAVVILIVCGLWMIWPFLVEHKSELPQTIIGVVNPYQLYIDELTSPSPSDQVRAVANTVSLLLTVPGWYPDSVTYDVVGQLNASMKSLGAKTKVLFDWGLKNNFNPTIGTEGFHLTIALQLPIRAPSDVVMPINMTVGELSDRLRAVLPGNVIDVSVALDKGKFSELGLAISFQKVSPTVLCLIGDQFKNLPLVLSKMSVNVENGSLTGSITLTALGT